MLLWFTSIWLLMTLNVSFMFLAICTFFFMNCLLKILRRGGKNTQKNCTKQIFTTQIITMVWSLTDILECEVKWALWSITASTDSGGDGIPVELFQILKDDAVKVLHSICQQIWKTQQWPQDGKKSVFIPIPKKGNAKEYSNYCTIALISHASKSEVAQSCLTLCDTMDSSLDQAPPSMGIF